MPIGYNNNYFRVSELCLKYGVKATWAKSYVILETYKKTYGNLKIDRKFKSNDGINYSEFGLDLNGWIYTQIHNNDKLSKGQRELLEILGIDLNKKPLSWDDCYSLVRAYYNLNGDLRIPRYFKTSNGLNYDANGVDIHAWLMRQINNKDRLTERQVELLNLLGTDFEKKSSSWYDFYKLLKIYYDYYGSLDMKSNFKTSNGIDYDPNGIDIYHWIVRQRKNKDKLTQEQIGLLDECKMKWDKLDSMEEWLEYYELAIEYHLYHGNLNVPYAFKTLNGIDFDPNGKPLGRWIPVQKQVYKANTTGVMTPEKIRLLELLDIEWFTEKKYAEFKEEKIVGYNAKQKKLCITHILYSLLNTYDEDELPCKKRINEEFMKKLSTKKQS